MASRVSSVSAGDGDSSILLVPWLGRALTLAKRENTAVRIGQRLNLDVPCGGRPSR
jgi:hypothetical protein